MLLTFKD